MQRTITNTLTEQIGLLKQLNNQQYNAACAELSNGTIGQHTRHIIELFQCLQYQYESGTVNYDLRQRNKQIETDCTYAIAKLNEIIDNLNRDDKPLHLMVQLNEKAITLSTNYYRELYYNLEHCIHHQALIKVALLKYSHISVSHEFGVAPSTLQYRLQNA